MNALFKMSLMCFLVTACGDTADDSALDSGECVPQCPESENSTDPSDIPCGTDDGDDHTVEESCIVLEECGEVFYCRTTDY